MEDAEEAQSFIEKLSNDLFRLRHLKSFDKAVVWQYFDSKVLELEDANPELMSFLTENRHVYGKSLLKLAKRLASNSCNTQTALSCGQKHEAQLLPYNLYASNKVKKRTVQKHHSNPCSIYSAYLSERMVHLKDSKAVLKLLKHCLNSPASSVQCSWLQEVKKLCAVAIFRTEPKVLQLVMEIFNMRLSLELECKGCNEERLSDVKSSVEDFVTFCSRKHKQVGEFSKKPRFCDLLAATMSMYTDVVLRSYRNRIDSDQKKEGKKLCGLICCIFHDHPEFVLDVVIQLSECQSSDGTILVPLCKKALAKPVGNVDPVFYTKYIVASCQCRRLFPELMSDVIAQVQDVAAPADYVNWLKEKNSSITDVLPAKKHFSDFRITKFLLEKATDDLLNKLLDVLTDADVLTEDKLDSVLMTSEDHADEMFFFDRASSSANTRFLQQEDMEIAESEHDTGPVDVEEQGGIINSFDCKAVCDTEIVIRFDRGSAMSSEAPGEREKDSTDVGDGHGEEGDENDELSSLEDILEEVDGKVNEDKIDENSSSDELVEQELQDIIEVTSDVHKADSVAQKISDESENEENHELLINRVLDSIQKEDTSDSDMFEELVEISRKNVGFAEKQLMREVEGTFIEGDSRKVLEVSEPCHKGVQIKCNSKDLVQDKAIEFEIGKLTYNRDTLLDSESHENDSETPSKHKDENQFCIGTLKANNSIRDPHTSDTVAVVSQSEKKPADQVIKCAEGTTRRSYTMLKSGDRTPEEPKKDHGKRFRDSDDGRSIRSPKGRYENRDTNEVDDSSTGLEVIEISPEKTISTQTDILDTLKSRNQAIKLEDRTPEKPKKSREKKRRDSIDEISTKSPKDSFVEPSQLRQSKSGANCLRLPSAWSPKHDCSTPQSPTVTLNRTIVADSSERCSAKSPQSLTSSCPQVPDFKKFLTSSENTIDVYQFNSDIEKSPLFPYTRLAKRRDSEHEASSPTQTVEKAKTSRKGVGSVRSSEFPEIFCNVYTHSQSGKRGPVGMGPVPELGVEKQNEISVVIESSPSTPAKAERVTHNTEGRAGSEDPDGNLTRRRSVRLQNKLSVAAKDCAQDVPSSPVVNSRKRKASALMEGSKRLES